MSMSPTTAQILARLTDAFERVACDLDDHGMSAAPKPMTLTDCVPLLAIAIELINRGPTALTIEAVEDYRANALRLIADMRPVIEHEAELTMAEWADGLTEDVPPAA